MAREDDCFVCRKHSQGERAQGGIVFADDLVYVGHVHTSSGGATVYRGWLVVEPKRHVAQLGDLSDDEARAIGSMVNWVAKALRDTLGAEHVYSFVYGDAVAHLHVHLAPRYPRTPREYWGPRLLDWADAARVDEPEMRRLVGQLRHGLTNTRDASGR